MIPRTGIAVSRKELLGLLVMFIVYVLLGGLVFMLLESPLEEQLRKEYSELRDEFRESLDRLTTSNLTRDAVENLIIRLATAHSNNLIDDDGNETHTNWSFINSFFFAITVVTTIGYGHLAPSTTPGRMFCLLYAMFGIPLTGILLAAIGGHFSQHLVKKLQNTRKSRRNSRLVLFLTGAWCLLPWFLLFLVLPAGIFVFTEGWSFVEGIYYCFITLSTIGFGDYVASNFEGQYIWLYKTCIVLWIIFGLGYLAMILNYISRAMRCKQIRRVERRLSTSIHYTQQKMGQRLEEAYQILHEMSRHRPIRHRSRALKRIQSYPAPEMGDRNHNHKIQRLLKLVQNLKEEQEETPQKTRRLSLPLPSHPQMAATGARGSLQVFIGSKEHELIKNGCQKNLYDNTVQSGNTTMRKDFTHTVLEVSVKEKMADKHALLDFEGLQCTRV